MSWRGPTPRKPRSAKHLSNHFPDRDTGLPEEGLLNVFEQVSYIRFGQSPNLKEPFFYARRLVSTRMAINC